MSYAELTIRADDDKQLLATLKELGIVTLPWPSGAHPPDALMEVYVGGKFVFSLRRQRTIEPMGPVGASTEPTNPTGGEKETKE